MVNKSKAKGTAFETWVLAHLRRALPHFVAERLPLVGNLDQGDLVIVDGVGNRSYVLEAKAVQRMDLPSHLAEAKAEAENYAAVRGKDPLTVFGVVVLKRRRAPVGGSYVIMDLDTFVRMVD